MTCICCKNGLEAVEEAIETLAFAAGLLEKYNLPEAAKFRQGVKRVQASVKQAKRLNH